MIFILIGLYGSIGVEKMNMDVERLRELNRSSMLYRYYVEGYGI